MKILLFGPNGQIGSEFKNIFKNKNVVLSKKSLKDLLHNDLEEYIININPDIIINCSAYTDVDGAEIEKVICDELNVDAVEIIVKAAKKINCLLIHFSTDYVFNGKSLKPYVEDATHDPINYYGLSKSRGEFLIKENSSNYLIFRVSWVFGKNGNNFPKKIISMLKSKNEIKVINDQFSSPTYSKDIASVVKNIIERLDMNISYRNTYHLSSDLYLSWYEFSEMIKQTLQKENLAKIIPVGSDQFDTDAKRPKNSALDPSKLYNDFNISLPKCNESLIRFFQDLEIDFRR